MDDFKLDVCGGCNAKLSQNLLDDILSSLNPLKRDDILVGFDKKDDAAVIAIDDKTSIVTTLDFFPAMVDDPYVFGQIAATNALSDVYAMGADPVCALNIVAFPEDGSMNILKKILKGGADKVREAGASLVGGHSIHDQKIKYGLSVTGKVDLKKLWRNSCPKKGDSLILTKPLGVTLVTNAYSVGLVNREQLDGAIKSMTFLNKYAKEIFEKYRVSSATDVTGFGLLCHLGEMLDGNYTAILNSSNIPILDGARNAASNFVFTKGGQRNRMFIEDRVEFQVDDFALEEILYDPQSSGGLLVAVNNEDANDCLEELRENGIEANIIGKIYDKYDKDIFVI